MIPAEERWKADDFIRPAIEDLLGAGVIIQHLEGRLSPKARIARILFLEAQKDLDQLLRECAAGQELIAMGFEQHLTLIGALNADGNGALLIQGDHPS